MNWENLKNSIINKVQFDEVTEDMKTAFIKWFTETVFPVIKAAGEDFVYQVKEQASSETGWCKIRDLIVIPFMVEGSLWAADYVLGKINKLEVGG